MLSRVRGLTVLAACAVWTACAAGPERGVRSLDELPPAHRELWVAWLADEPDWPERRARALEDGALTGFLVDNLAREMLRAYGRGEIASLGSGSHGPFERARAELAILGEHAVPTLGELLVIGNGATGMLAGDVLAEIGRPALDYVAALLERPSPTARRRAAELLARLPHGRGREGAVRDALVARLDRDPDWSVRAAVCGALGARGARDVETAPWRRALVAALGDGERSVTRGAVQALAALEDPAAVPALIRFLERSQGDGDLAGYRVAQDVLQGLTGTAQRRTPAGWGDWWRARGTR